jgi:hypothetical protein
MSVVVMVLGAAILLSAAWACYRAWTQVGLRLTQRWTRTVWSVLTAVFFGAGLIVLPLQQPAMTSVWIWVAFAVALVSGLAAVAIWFASLLSAITAKRRDTELGIPTAPRPVSFWLPCLLWTLALSVVAVMIVWPWVFLTVWSEALQQCLPSGCADWTGLNSGDGRLWLAIYAPTGTMLALSALLVGGRFLLRQRRIQEHTTLVEGIRSRERASYEAGYNDGRHDREPAQ